MTRGNRIALGLGLAGAGWAVAAVWCWALFGMSEEVGQANSLTALALLFAGFLAGMVENT